MRYQSIDANLVVPEIECILKKPKEFILGMFSVYSRPAPFEETPNTVSLKVEL